MKLLLMLSMHRAMMNFQDCHPHFSIFRVQHHISLWQMCGKGDASHRTRRCNNKHRNVTINGVQIRPSQCPNSATFRYFLMFQYEGEPTTIEAAASGQGANVAKPSQSYGL